MRPRPTVGINNGWKPQPTDVRNTAQAAPPTVRARTIDMLLPVMTRIGSAIRRSSWVLTRVSIRYPVRWFVWVTAHDERTCPECGAMHGRTWPEDRPVPPPPLHVNCRCQVVLHHLEWRTRYIPTWQLRHTVEQVWTWTQTGWR